MGNNPEQIVIHDLEVAGHTPHCARRIVWGDGECECGWQPMADHIVDANKKVEPAPAPLPKNVKWALRELSAYAVQNPETPLGVMYAAIDAHITDLTRRLAEAEAELQCSRKEGCPASILWELCEIRKALGLELITTSYTEILPAIKDWVDRARRAEEFEQVLLRTPRECTVRAESAEAKCRDLESFKSRIMAWARGRCNACGTLDKRTECRTCVRGREPGNVDKWTPPQAWEVGK